MKVPFLILAQLRLTVFVFDLLRQDLEVKQPRFYPGQNEGDDGQQVPKGPLTQQLHKKHTHTSQYEYVILHRSIQNLTISNLEVAKTNMYYCEAAADYRFLERR